MKFEALPTDGSPLYLQIASFLEREIEKGTFRVGSLLPPEAALAEQLGISRHTLREAIARLRRAGRLSARKGVGTRVEAGSDSWRNRFRAQSRDDLFDLAKDSEFHIQIREEVAARGKLAVDLGCRSGRIWNFYAGVRYFLGETKPFCWNEVYLEPRFAPILKDVDVLRSALFTLIESRTGERIEEIQQEIRPTLITGEMAEALQVKDGSLGLKLSRRFLGSGRRLLELAIQVLPEEEFVFRSTLSSSTDRFATQGS
jgi:GntR family transcriptional regulator